VLSWYKCDARGRTVVPANHRRDPASARSTPASSAAATPARRSHTGPTTSFARSGVAPAARTTPRSKPRSAGSGTPGSRRQIRRRQKGRKRDLTKRAHPSRKFSFRVLTNQPIFSLPGAVSAARRGESPMERRKTARPEDVQADLQDVRLYLDRVYPDQAPICLTIHRHYGSEADEIAYLVVEVDHQETWRRIRSAGEIRCGTSGIVLLLGPEPMSTTSRRTPANCRRMRLSGRWRASSTLPEPPERLSCGPTAPA
jgi:hypothetical protein